MITGLGAVSPFGVGAGALWQGLLEGRSAVSRITRFDPEGLEVHIAAEVDDGCEAMLRGHSNARLRWLLAALREALEDASLEPRQAAAGVSVAGGELNVRYVHMLPAVADALVGGALDGGRLQRALVARDGAGLGRAHHSAAASLVAATIGAEARFWRHPARAPRNARDQAGRGEHRMGGRRHLPCRRHRFPRGAYDSAADVRLGALCTDSNDAPERASRPFDISRSGFVMAEGAAVLVLEALDHALARGGRVRGEVVGFGTSLDAYRVTDPEPEGLGATLQYGPRWRAPVVRRRTWTT